MKCTFLRKNVLSNQKGLVLAASVIVIIVLSIAILSLTTFVVQKLEFTKIRMDSTDTLYLAQAGMHASLYLFRNAGGFAIGQTQVDASRGKYYEIAGGSGGEKDLLMIDTSNATIQPPRVNRLNGLVMGNARNPGTIEFTSMIITWDQPTNIRRINLQQCSNWGGNLSSPATIPITCTLNAGPATKNIQRIAFNGDMTAATIDIQFNMRDGTSKTVRVYQAGTPLPFNNFTVHSTGQDLNSNISRTIRAEYNAITSLVNRYEESIP